MPTASLHEIYRGRFFSSYSQLALLDAADPEFPQWERDSGAAVFGPRGVAFTVRNDTHVEVIVYRGVGPPGGRLTARGQITVGVLGLAIGSIDGDTDLLDWPVGLTEVAIYTSGRDPFTVRRMRLVLRPAADDAAPQAPGKPTIAARVGEILGRVAQPNGLGQYDAASALARLGREAVSPLLDALRHADPRVRATAIRALGQLRDNRAVEPFIAALGDEEDYVREEAAQWLGWFRDQRATEPLLAALARPEHRLRLFAVGGLGQLRDKRAIQPLIRILTDEGEDLFVREEAARALGTLKAREALDPLVAAFRDGIDHFRHAIGQAFLYLGNAALPTLLTLVEDDDPAVRRMAALTLGHLRRASVVEPLTRALSDPDAGVRAAAAYACEQMHDPAAVAPLVAALRDESATVRYTAARALGLLGDPSALPVLEDLRRRHEGDQTADGGRVYDEASKAIQYITYRHKR